MKPGFWPDLEKMTETIHKAGYKPIEGQVELIVTGTVVKQADGSGAQLAIELDQMQAPATLTVVAAKGDPDTAEHLNRHLGEHVEVEGLWQPRPLPSGAPGAPDGDKGGLAVTAIYGAEDKKPKR